MANDKKMKDRKVSDTWPDNPANPLHPDLDWGLWNRHGLSKREWLTGIILNGLLAGGYKSKNVNLLKDACIMADNLVRTLNEEDK